MAERKEALTGLMAKVETGIVGDGLNTSSCFDAPHDMDAVDAFDGSLDAAKALHEAVLPGWGWHIRQDGDGCYASCLYPKHSLVTPGSGESDNPARAWLIATLKALAAQEDA